MNPPLAQNIRKLIGDSILSIPNDDGGIMTPQATLLSGAATAASGALDLFILTFNCAKNLIDVPVFSAHLHGALRQNSSSLPDLVAFSLQEFAPLSHAFIGSYFLNPYYAKYEEALNLGSAKFLKDQGSPVDQEDDLDYAEGGAPAEEEGLLKPVKISRQQEQPQQQSQVTKSRPYTLVKAKNVGMTAILLFARDPTTITRIEEAECGFGAADMGNKGAVGLRVSWRRDRDSREEAEVTLVATHLAAMEWNLKKRNANWRSIASGLTFANPKAALPGVFGANNEGPRADQSGAGDKVGSTAATADGSSSDSSELEDDESANQPLLNGEGGETLTPEQQAKLKDISVFKPSSYLFVAGDLNYRISSTTPPPLSDFPSFDPTSPNHFSTFLPRDQLTQERLAGRAFQGMSEAPISFGPTYKYNILQKPDGAVNEEAVRSGVERDGIPEVPWKFAPHRWPGWCDRVLYLDLPSWLKTKTRKVEVKAYNSLPVVRTSDHRAVFLRVQIPVVGGGTMRKGLEMEENNSEEGVVQDPRVNPPVLVDAHAWERREAARRKELLVGLSAFVWSTQEGAILLATLVLLGAGSWWATRGW